MTKTKEQVLQEIRERNKKAVSYEDWWYFQLKTEVCDIDTGDNKVYRVPEYVGREVAKIVDDKNKNNEMIALGDVRIRAYMVKRMEFKKERFTSMSDWAKGMLLKHNPNLLSKYEKDFSPRLKEHLAEIKQQKNNSMKALEKTETWVLE